jgi:hypothetical protein
MLLGAQVVVPLLLAVLRPGFDFPNQFGMGFETVLAAAALFVVLWIAGLVMSCRLPHRRFLFVFLCLLSPVVCVGIFNLLEPIFVS